MAQYRKRTSERDSGAKIALLVAVLALAVAVSGTIITSIVAAGQHHNLHIAVKHECQDLNAVKLVNREALQAAIIRARASLTDPAVRFRSIKELQREIGLLVPQNCGNLKG